MKNIETKFMCLKSLGIITLVITFVLLNMGFAIASTEYSDDEVLVARILERGKTSGRVDDQDENKIRTRYNEYNEKTAPLIDYYTKQNKYYSVDGIGTIEEVTERLSKVIDSL